MIPPKPKLRYEMRCNGPSFQLPMKIIEGDSEEEIIEKGRQRAREFNIRRGVGNTIYIYPQDIKQITLRPVPTES